MVSEIKSQVLSHSDAICCCRPHVLQKDEIERVMKRMKTLKQIPQSWQPEVLMRRSPSKTSPRKRRRHSGDRGVESDPCKTSPRSRPLLVRGGEDRVPKLERSRVHNDKVEKLRDYFENVRLTPVKKIATGIFVFVTILGHRMVGLHESAVHRDNVFPFQKYFSVSLIKNARTPEVRTPPLTPTLN